MTERNVVGLIVLQAQPVIQGDNRICQLKLTKSASTKAEVYFWHASSSGGNHSPMAEGSGGFEAKNVLVIFGAALKQIMHDGYVITEINQEPAPAFPFDSADYAVETVMKGVGRFKYRDPKTSPGALSAVDVLVTVDVGMIAPIW
jgi:hypothetical protein